MPSAGTSTTSAVTTPSTAPSVLAAYRRPSTRPNDQSHAESALVSSGRVAPMAVDGKSSSTNESASRSAPASTGCAARAVSRGASTEPSAGSTWTRARPARATIASSAAYWPHRGRAGRLDPLREETSEREPRHEAREHEARRRDPVAKRKPRLVKPQRLEDERRRARAERDRAHRQDDGTPRCGHGRLYRALAAGAGKWSTRRPCAHPPQRWWRSGDRPRRTRYRETIVAIDSRAPQRPHPPAGQVCGRDGGSQHSRGGVAQAPAGRRAHRAGARAWSGPSSRGAHRSVLGGEGPRRGSEQPPSRPPRSPAHHGRGHRDPRARRGAAGGVGLDRRGGLREGGVERGPFVTRSRRRALWRCASTRQSVLGHACRSS